jgi:hypothetical protein
MILESRPGLEKLVETLLKNTKEQTTKQWSF